MSSVASDAIGGFNSFLNDQKQLSGEATLTLVQFDDQYEMLDDFKPIKEVNDLDSFTFQPRGTTALLDAIGRTIDTIGNKLALMKETDRPEKVIVVVITDGFENASRRFTAKQINEMITHQQEDYNWQFTFIGSNQDAITSAKELGIAASAALTNSPNQQGVKMSYDILSANVGAVRSGLRKTLTYSDDDRKKAFHK